MPRPLRGIVPPLVTPLTGRDTLDEAGLERLIEHVLAGGVHGLFILGTTGEAPSLSHRLREQMVRCTCRAVAGRRPVLVGITDTAFIESVNLARTAADAGADAVVLAPPYCFPAGQAELAEYIDHIAAEMPLPVPRLRPGADRQRIHLSRNSSNGVTWVDPCGRPSGRQERRGGSDSGRYYCSGFTLPPSVRRRKVLNTTVVQCDPSAGHFACGNWYAPATDSPACAPCQWNRGLPSRWMTTSAWSPLGRTLTSTVWSWLLSNLPGRTPGTPGATFCRMCCAPTPMLSLRATPVALTGIMTTTSRSDFGRAKVTVIS
ncbi:MAG: dihydrodipicolinate synthase family protein [Planctomycetes bacterium]|nr:dihydrodipicolinate synthase family protein [Planctomycetota bacterium]